MEKLKIDKNLVFLYANKPSERESTKAIPFTFAAKNKIFRNKLNQECKELYTKKYNVLMKEN